MNVGERRQSKPEIKDEKSGASAKENYFKSSGSFTCDTCWSWYSGNSRNTGGCIGTPSTVKGKTELSTPTIQQIFFSSVPCVPIIYDFRSMDYFLYT
ncbi:hypothetical protein AX774_g2143 [Zancudomyces culisetae]|uniref:Uncharacterized protein n=1 Tax=Zancudomyces culisetae TaxID=1213189 RepID=A0A1R1PTV8_ZANCU|nr:hypothetical protein AX774_g2143 [Zancudomyces culisetae]|eukprot:OMH84343.1 hypothetical protein AX774_g2143 [Zancudomyces culisetae]